MFQFNKHYFVIAILLFIVEVLIALFVDDNFVRPYAGDFLVVIFLYCLVKSCFQSTPAVAGISVLLFSYLIETLQFFNFVHHLGLSHSKFANVVLGNYFTWVDILAYTLGIAFVFGGGSTYWQSAD